MRWITGIPAAILLAFFLYKAPENMVLAVIWSLSLVGFNEFRRMTLSQLPVLHKVAGLLLTGGLCGYILLYPDGEALLLVLFGVLSLSCFLFFWEKSVFEKRLRDLALFVFGVLYCGILFSFLGLIRTLEHWPFWFILMLAATFLADTGAYVFGRLLGKHKLAPDLSPGKTIEGFLGGWLFAVIAVLIVRYLFLPDADLIKTLVLGTVIAFVGPVGDLSESLIKRAMQVKDSGSFLPGHGGLLDRVDALLFTAPCVYLFAKYIF
jgi:phosphatidate cytidylyltransferase